MATHESTSLLLSRFDCVVSRAFKLEQFVKVIQKFDHVITRLSHLEMRLQSLHVCGGSTHIKNHDEADGATITSGASSTQNRLELELKNNKCSSFRFVRAPPDYYAQALEYRMRCVGASSVNHLCKSMIMENTRAHPSVDGWSNPLNSKYYVVIVQYTARLHTEKLKNFVYKLSEGKIGKQYFNMRLAPSDVSDTLSGFVHNAVTPIGMATPLPIILSHRIPALQPDFFFLGGGEVDLKLGLLASQFIKAYAPMIADCTYDNIAEGEE
ncbi:hypothetical protein CEUSTIGMA_g7791.t1 [Chlamydomonas eustigma]|uniref:YbaK/aminoacyl-tRNA synthetase-associated domain-containing protein n=1 Tax=Chlamydomonas eustigma TaxID=1157962 RepID=A0A250XBV1_9CHLO|nr:hypothetical protein CEUSTIGMA_g7791.t1 [Chlamydomonas eustigma]|eukprot:GAX80352.1 hypothetical protein CEUSTIGMA_g7791.t1 [Chlamydomonas eustigma]